MSQPDVAGLAAALACGTAGLTLVRFAFRLWRQDPSSVARMKRDYPDWRSRIVGRRPRRGHSGWMVFNRRKNRIELR
jgi:hypothetical protein